jgi:hypothetical protein
MFWGCGIFHFEGLKRGEKGTSAWFGCEKRNFSSKLTSIYVADLKEKLFRGVIYEAVSKQTT